MIRPDSHVVTIVIGHSQTTYILLLAFLFSQNIDKFSPLTDCDSAFVFLFSAILSRKPKRRDFSVLKTLFFLYEDPLMTHVLRVSLERSNTSKNKALHLHPPFCL